MSTILINLCALIFTWVSTSRKKCRGEKHTGDTEDVLQKLSGVLNPTHLFASTLKGTGRKAPGSTSWVGADGGGQKEQGYGSLELIYLERNKQLPSVCNLSPSEPVQLWSSSGIYHWYPTLWEDTGQCQEKDHEVKGTSQVVEQQVQLNACLFISDFKSDGKARIWVQIKAWCTYIVSVQELFLKKQMWTGLVLFCLDNSNN